MEKHERDINDITLDYHKQQYLVPKRSTVAFEKFLSKHVDIKGNLLDLACGGGAVDAYIAKHHPEVIIRGIDIDDTAFRLLREYVDEEVCKRVTLEKGDWYNLNKNFVDFFDGVISLQALSWLDDWKEPMGKIIELRPKYIALSSLFYEGKIEFQVKATDYERSDENDDHDEQFRNIYSLPIIKQYLNNNGYTIFDAQPFEIDIDIPKPNHFDFETYTIKTSEDRRLQISAGMLMPWFFIYAQKE